MKKRVLSAIVMALIAIPILIIGKEVFAIFVGLLAVCGAYELIKIRETERKFPFLIKIFAYLMVLFFTLNNFDSIEFLYNIDCRVLSFLLFVFLVPVVFINDKDKYNIMDGVFLITTIVFIGLSFNLIILIRNFDLKYIIYLLLITITTDTFALVTGSLIGKTPLAPRISPKKTIEGSIGGSIMGTIIPTIFYMMVINPRYPLVIIILITCLLSCVGQLGDLFFSFVKREYNKKDFSNIIPGHGGILDRFDSLIFVVLTFILFISII